MKFLLVSFAIFMAVNAASVEPESPHPNEAPSKTDSPTAKDGASGTPLVHGDHNLIPFPEFDKPPPQQPRERRGWLARAAGNVADTARLVSQVVVSGVNFVRGLVTGESRGGVPIDFNTPLSPHKTVAPAAVPIVEPTPAAQATPPTPAAVPIIAPPTPAAQATPPATPSAESVGPTGTH